MTEQKVSAVIHCIIEYKFDFQLRQVWSVLVQKLYIRERNFAVSYDGNCLASQESNKVAIPSKTTVVLIPLCAIPQ